MSTLLEKTIDHISDLHQGPRHKNELIQSLTRLSQMAGINDIKLDVAKNVRLLTLFPEAKNRFTFHSLIMGPPGVGKTTMAKILGEVYLSLGVLDVYDHSLDAAADALLHSQQIIQSEGVTPELQKILCDMEDMAEKIITHHINTDDEFDVTCNSKIVFCGRENLVAGYQGQSSTKAIEFFEAHRGHVIIFDEAYILFMDKQDVFGSEVLKLINDYMDRNEHIFIFVGYEDKIKESIFKGQEGLSRRIGRHYVIPGYGGDELYKIFDIQAEREGWAHSLCKKFFFGKTHLFPFYGGDTIRLLRNAILESASRQFELKAQPEKLLLLCDINAALLGFQQRIKDNPCPHMYV